MFLGLGTHTWQHVLQSCQKWKAKYQYYWVVCIDIRDVLQDYTNLLEFIISLGHIALHVGLVMMATLLWYHTPVRTTDTCTNHRHLYEPPTPVRTTNTCTNHPHLYEPPTPVRTTHTFICKWTEPQMPGVAGAHVLTLVRWRKIADYMREWTVWKEL